MKRLLLSLLIVPFLNIASAQTAWDGLQLSQNYYGGTARFNAMGGAFTALGGDFAALSVNPAGIGVFRNWEFMITPTVSYNITTTKYLDQTNKDSYTSFGLDNLGVAFNIYDNYSEANPITLNFGIGYNKLNQFINRTSASGTNYNNSLAAAIAIATNGTNVNVLDGHNAFSDANWTSVLAWDTFIIDVLPGTTDQYAGATENILPNNDIIMGGPVNQYYYKESSGNVGEYVFSFGGNVADQFYFGLNFDIQDIRRDVYQTITESAVNSGNFDTGFNNFTYESAVETRGVGYNIKLGLIWKPIDGLRVGGYFHSPTWMYLSDRYWESMRSRFDPTSTAPAATYKSESPEGAFDYRINTPLKWGGGLAYVIGKMAIISVEYEGADYGATTMLGYNGQRYVKLAYTGNDPRYRFEDDYTKQNFGLVTNVRAGAEVRLNPVAIRAGYAYYGSPVKDDNDYARNIFSVGLGYSVGGFYIDGAYAFSPNNKQTQSFYNDSPYIETDSFFGKISLTLGFRL